MREYDLRIGEEAVLKGSFFTAGHAMVYAGMPSDNVYSLAFVYKQGYQAMAANIFIPVSQRELTYKGYRITVLDVRSDHIRLKVDK